MNIQHTFSLRKKKKNINSFLLKKSISGVTIYLSQRRTKSTKWPMKTQISLGVRSLIRAFAVRKKKAWVLSYPLNAKADLSLCWVHIPFCRFCRGLAHLLYNRRILNVL